MSRMTEQQQIAFVLEHAWNYVEKKEKELRAATEHATGQRIYWAQLRYDNAYDRWALLEEHLPSLEVVP